jgi:3-oxoacyl-[acyl-carrier protein] reductase
VAPNPKENQMSFDFTGQRVLVAGGSRGIGRAIALNFAAAGAAVGVCARDSAALEAARADIARHGQPVHAMACDLADAASIAAWVPAAAEALGGIDVLVNNASGFGMGDDEAGWAAGLAVDVMAMVRCSRAALPWLQRAGAAGGASIIHLSSISAYRPSTRSAAYAAVKAAMNSYTGSQAAMLCREGIRVNAIAPGSIEFPGGVWEQRRADNPALYQRTLASIPFGRMGTPDEIAEVALFLASRHARWMTGQVLSVDGGQLLGV